MVIKLSHFIQLLIPFRYPTVTFGHTSILETSSFLRDLSVGSQKLHWYLPPSLHQAYAIFRCTPRLWIWWCKRFRGFTQHHRFDITKSVGVLKVSNSRAFFFMIIFGEFNDTERTEICSQNKIFLAPCQYYCYYYYFGGKVSQLGLLTTSTRMSTSTIFSNQWCFQSFPTADMTKIK